MNIDYACLPHPHFEQKNRELCSLTALFGNKQNAFARLHMHPWSLSLALCNFGHILWCLLRVILSLWTLSFSRIRTFEKQFLRQFLRCWKPARTISCWFVIWSPLLAQYSITMQFPDIRLAGFIIILLCFSFVAKKSCASQSPVIDIHWVNGLPHLPGLDPRESTLAQWEAAQV